VGAIPVPLIIAGDESRTTAGADYLTPTMCPFALSQIGSYLQRENSDQFAFLNLLDAVIATNYCAADTLVNEWISRSRKNSMIFSILSEDRIGEDSSANFFSTTSSPTGFSGSPGGPETYWATLFPSFNQISTSAGNFSGNWRSISGSDFQLLADFEYLKKP
jgi:hypothetical protein